MGCRLNDGFLFISLVFGISVEAGEPCYTDYYTLEFCDHGCCGTNIPDRHCCNGPTPEPGRIIGYSVGGGVFLIIIIIIIVCLCKYTGRKATKTTSYVHQPEGALPSVSEQTEPVSERYDKSFHSHFPRIKHACSGSKRKRVGLNSTIIEEPCSYKDEKELCTIHIINRTNERTSHPAETMSDGDLVLTPVLTNN